MRFLLAASLLAAFVLGCVPANALYSASSPVVDLNPANFQTKIKAAGFYLVEFYAPWCGHCKSLVPEYEKAAKALKGMIGVGSVNADEHKSLGGEYQIQGFPTIKLLYVENGQIKSTDYQGGRTAKDIVSFVMDKAKSFALKRLGEKSSGGSGGSKGGSKGGNKGGSGSDGGFYSGTDVVTLTDSNFEDEVTNSDDLVFVEFYAPWCGHCQRLKPDWIEAATELKGKVKVAAVDCTAHQSACGQFGVRGYPTIKFFGTDKQNPEDYQAGRDAGSIVSFAKEKWSSVAPPPEVRELLDEHVFEKECLGDKAAGKSPKQLCFVAFLPDILDSGSAGRNGYVATLKKLSEKYKDRPFSYLWLAAGQQPDLESNFGVGGFGYPALIAFKPKDKKYSVSKSAFELKHVVEFVESIRKGGEAVLSISGELASIKAVAPWDGKDGKVEAVDEFSLDDLFDKDEL
mmetsp:Transcript_11091/g.23921  ORF Transcript_11091/g.23921 Transcript_11091/m.23921 type:complete len:457 (+) Transcript_11091:59-1429(+)|eukprot:CAMPEP_0202900258 /NCGR_PEP_ID=MMETSP1392-20130828/10659_1 /ASSEMBLY_ACC=CAM_ASM_000868 /TAXON_ID=225041 /ORGANISM="Chlamydomonas chlamydogama, Strain SAG 11-48b" /LENGTH=456 /DNA_ID=CAMNT_0049586607 /DNA_START=59 /DNA_END=1429 /DNA_ORIENTATION=+